MKKDLFIFIAVIFIAVISLIIGCLFGEVTPMTKYSEQEISNREHNESLKAKDVRVTSGTVNLPTYEAPVRSIESNNVSISSTTATLYITTGSYVLGDYVQAINPNSTYVILVGTSSTMNKIIGIVDKNYGSYTWDLDHPYMYLLYQAGASDTTIYGGHYRRK